MNHTFKTAFYLLLGSLSAAATAQTTRNSAPPLINRGPAAEYPVPYQTPTVQGITEALNRIHKRLEPAIVCRVIDTQTRQEITDLSQPNPNAFLDSGEDGKYRPLIYPVAVVYHGMLAAHEATGDARFADFVVKRFEWYDKTLAQVKDWPGRRNPFAFFLRPTALDHCGAMGAAMIKARRANLGPDFKPLIDRFAQYVYEEEFRLADGTLARTTPVRNSVWADDMYMGIPILAQMGKLTGEQRYYDEAVKQTLQIAAPLFHKQVGLFTHGWNTLNPDAHPRYYWGRANGWCLMAMAELLEVLPEDHPRRAHVLELFRAHAQGVASTQSHSGLWRQLLDRQDSFLESSATGMITFAIARGVNRGWLDAFTFGPIAQAGWNGLSTRITADGRVEQTCIGTNYSNDFVYYYNRPAIDDPHGYGPALLAGAEMIKLLKNPAIRIETTRTGPATYRNRAPAAAPESNEQD